MWKLLSFLALLLISIQAAAEQIVLHPDHFEHIHFRRIQPTLVNFEPDKVHFDVNKSSSFLLLAFDDIKTVRKISFEWKAEGMLNKDSAAQEKTRAGDDAWLRVGLVISGQADPVPEALLPRWVKKVRQTLKFPSDRVLYLVPDARHEPGETWQSPYNANIRMISVASRRTDAGWMQASHELAEPRQAVGLWLMADGDNTASIFRSQLRKLVIE